MFDSNTALHSLDTFYAEIEKTFEQIDHSTRKPQKALISTIDHIKQETGLDFWETQQRIESNTEGY
ncbi:MAG: hypothetical protein OCC49_02985 [Fibrobacterales bacterium]